MRSFIVSLSSEFYKSRKTLAFWSAILLPLVICVLISFGFINKATRLANDPAALLWLRYITAILGVMGTLLLPILVIYNTYAITNMEYKGDTWKSLFSLPLPKFSIYTSKYIYVVFLTFLTMLLFCVFIIATGHVIEFFKPELEFSQYNPNTLIFKFFTKLFLSVIGIVSIQFLLNLVWNDFLKSFGIGFTLTILGIITVNVGWNYVDYVPYAFPGLTVMKIMESGGKLDKFQMFDQPIYNSLIYGAVFFIIGYVLLARKTIK